MRLESLSLVVAKRNRKGHVVAAFFRPACGANPLRGTCNMGQRYIVRERVGGEHEIFQHKRLIQRQDLEQLLGVELDSEEDVDLYLRGVFRAVPLSILNSRQPSAVSHQPKVVSIEVGRKKRRPATRERLAA